MSTNQRACDALVALTVTNICSQMKTQLALHYQFSDEIRKASWETLEAFAHRVMIHLRTEHGFHCRLIRNTDCQVVGIWVELRM